MIQRMKVALCAAAVIAALPAAALCQGRSSVTISDPGRMRTLGQGTASEALRNNSYGLGAAQPSGSGGISADPLKSNTGPATVSGYRADTSTAGTGDSGMLTSPLSSTKNKSTGTITSSGTLGGLSTLGGDGPKTDAAEAAGMSDYLSMASIGTGDSLKAQTKPLTSLVPSEASMFSDRMRRGEDAFKTNDYLRAISAFKLASDISADDWTSSLSLVHCYFAINTVSYSSSAHHLREALAHFPEMTALSIQPKEFFGDRSKYADALRRLEAHGGIGKSGADSRLVLAYFRWFDQQPEEAHKALAQALAFAIESGDSDNKEAIQAFWKGMVTSGKVSGELEPASLKAATQPADSAKPAEAKPAETTQSPEPLKPTEVEKPAAAKGKVTSQPAQSSDSPTS